MSHAEVQAFFETYRDAFNRLDGDAVADLWHMPSGITNSTEAAAQLTWWGEDKPMRANHRALCQRYRQAGYGRADFAIEQHVPMGPNHAFAHLHWTLQHHDGRVLLAVAHQEDLPEMKRHAAE